MGYIARTERGSMLPSDEPNAEDETGADPAGLDRRRFLRQAAIVGGTAWAVPTLVSMQPAGAASLTSPPPTGVGGTEITMPHGVGTTPTQVLPESTSTSTSTSNESLPRTGADIDRLVAGGLTAVAGGGALMYWSADRMKPAEVPATPRPGDGEDLSTGS
jgi:hypothetical protein